MYKACGRCGKIHDSRFKCTQGKQYKTTQERKMRSLNAWTEKSLEIRERANYLCEVCRDEGCYTSQGLEVHHIEKVKDRGELLLEDGNLICLCYRHHKQADRGQLSADYLRQLASARDAYYTPVG